MRFCFLQNLFQLCQVSCSANILKLIASPEFVVKIVYDTLKVGQYFKILIGLSKLANKNHFQAAPFLPNFN